MEIIKLIEILIYVMFGSLMLFLIVTPFIQQKKKEQHNNRLREIFRKKFGECRRFDSKGDGTYLVYTGTAIYEVLVKKNEIVEHQTLVG